MSVKGSMKTSSSSGKGGGCCSANAVVNSTYQVVEDVETAISDTAGAAKYLVVNSLATVREKLYKM